MCWILLWVFLFARLLLPAALWTLSAVRCMIILLPSYLTGLHSKPAIPKSMTDVGKETDRGKLAGLREQVGLKIPFKDML